MASRDTEPTKYVCTKDDLDLLLNDELKKEFWGLFYDTSEIEDMEHASVAELPQRKVKGKFLSFEP